MKTKNELKQINEEIATLNKKLAELTEDELAQIVGGVDILQSIKEKAISASTDSTSNPDRESIQQEIDRLLHQIDDNALVAFNGNNREL